MYVAWFVRVEQISEIVKEYEESLRGMPFVPTFSYGRRMMREDDALDTMFLTFLFSDQAIAITFLKDVGLLRCKVQCTIERSLQSQTGVVLQGNFRRYAYES